MLIRMQWPWCLLIACRVAQAERGQGHEARAKSSPVVAHIGLDSLGESSVAATDDAAELLRHAVQVHNTQQTSALQTRSQVEDVIIPDPRMAMTSTSTTPKHENRDPMKPLFKWHGDLFSKNDYHDLKVELKISGTFAGPFSIAFQFRQDYFTKFSRIFDFGDMNTPGTKLDLNNIQVMTTDKKGTMRFSVGDPKKSLYLDAEKAIEIGVMHDYLCTISSDGTMMMFRDGKIIGGPFQATAPKEVQRRYYYVGKSLWDSSTKTIKGVIGNVQVWDKQVLWQDPQWDNNLDREFPPDELGADLGFFGGWYHYIYNAGRGFWEVIMVSLGIALLGLVWCCCMLKAKQDEEHSGEEGNDGHSKNKKKENEEVEVQYG